MNFNPLHVLDLILADWASPKVRRLIHNLIALGVSLVGIWLAANGDWLVALGALAMLLLAFLPEAWSRGFGIGLTGARFDPATLPWYLIGGAAAGLAFSLADAKCGELSYGRPADEA